MTIGLTSKSFQLNLFRHGEIVYFCGGLNLNLSTFSMNMFEDDKAYNIHLIESPNPFNFNF